MSRHSERSRHSQSLALRSLGWLLAALLLVPAGLLAGDDGYCAELTLNATVRRDVEAAPGVRDCFRTPVLSRGVLTLDVSAPGALGAEPRLVLLGQGSAENCGYRLVRETPRGLIVEVQEPGILSLAVASEDPAKALLAYKLRTAFVSADFESVEAVTFAADPPDSCAAGAAPLTEEPIDDSGSWTALTDVDEEDCDVIELTTDVSGVVILGSADLTLQARLHADRACTAAPLAEGLLEAGGSSLAVAVHPETYRLDVASATGEPGSYGLGIRFFAPCGFGEVDDYGDTPLCATPVEPGSSVVGEIGNGMGDDEDFFTFVLDGQQTVEIEASGGRLTLYDGDVQRLDAGWCGEAERLVRTLGPGRYYVRVENSGTEGGVYLLRLGLVAEPM